MGTYFVLILTIFYGKLEKYNNMVEEKQQSIEEVEMEKAGLHYGHNKTRNHPQAAYFTIKSNAELSFINLDEKVKDLEAALNYIKEIIKKFQLRHVTIINSINNRFPNQYNLIPELMSSKRNLVLLPQSDKRFNNLSCKKSSLFCVETIT